ncbi:hypothetical protein EYF80_030896 [Liparis tanakae]|uniref:Uncharacterized protein n=1 Tax=Liparis tanakae TaxID=230148 RepID=A0A4Z2GZD5_9TELE|nr:hypothetical protein EYF80_030896 [Liparis tanakae]
MVLLKLHCDVTEATLFAFAAMVRGGRGGGSLTRFVQRDGGGHFVHGEAVAVAGRGARGTEALLVRSVRAPRAPGAERAAALRAAAVHRLHQEPLDPLAQLDDVGRDGPGLAARRRREHVFV